MIIKDIITNPFLILPVDRLSKEIRFPFGIMYPDVTFLPDYLTATKVRTAINYNKSDLWLITPFAVHFQSEQWPIFCVEIKPKQGWKFNGCAKDEARFQRLFQLPDRSMLAKCRYCVMQHLKVIVGISLTPLFVCLWVVDLAKKKIIIICN